MNMTNKLFIVKYVFVIVDVNIDENDAFLRNLNTNLDKRENFDDANFNAIVAQNICFLNVANKTNSIELNISNIANEIKIVDEIKKT